MAYSIKLNKIIEEFNLSVVYPGDDLDNVILYSEEINRPALPLTGFYHYFASDRLQVIGATESTYLGELTAEERRERFDMLFSKRIPALVIAHGIEPFAECVASAETYGIPVLSSSDSTSYFTSSLAITLKAYLAPRITRHGVLVEVNGEGLLLVGESGIGKSETAIELVKRGHRLIADDAVEIRRINSHELLGCSPELIRYYIELRGIGIIDIRKIFGIGAVKPEQTIDLIVNLERWGEETVYDRLGADDQHTNILGVDVPCVTIPVRPGRNLAVILEIAAMNNRQRKMGINSAQEFTDRINKHFEQALGK